MGADGVTLESWRESCLRWRGSLRRERGWKRRPEELQGIDLQSY